MISVCIATFNGSSYIKKQVESILPQLGVSDEIIISDDGSTDNTLGILQEINDVRIKIFKYNSPILSENYKNTTDFNRNRLIKNFENALSYSKGDIIFLSDQDDIWYSNKVEECTLSLNKYDLVVSDCSIIDENDRVLAASRFDIKEPSLGIVSSLVKNPFLGCCMAFNRNILEKALPFPTNISMHDIWIGMVAQTYFKTHLLEKILVGYRRHNHNMNNNKKSNSYKQKKNISQYSFREKIMFRINLIINLMKL